MKKKYILCPEANVSMVVFQGDTIVCPYQDLVKLFGNPTIPETEKTQFEWIFIGPNGSIITIFDWNSHSDTPDRWKVGAIKEKHSKDFIKWFNYFKKQK